jgi:hypothetical protein
MPRKCNENCPAFWDSYSSYLGDGDCGCLIRDIEEYDGKCRLPLVLIKVKVVLKNRKEKKYWEKKCEELDRKLMLLNRPEAGK